MVDIMTHLHDYVPKDNTPSDPEKLLIVPYCGDQLHSTSQYLSPQNVYETKLHNFLTDTSFCQICPLLCKVPKAYQKSKSKHKAFLQKSLQSQGNSQGSTWDNPHLQRIATDHSYISQQLEPLSKRRRLPEYLAKHLDTPHVSDNQQQLAPDGVLNYSSSVLNDGLLMLELRDTIREGDGPWIIRCWKVMIVYFKYVIILTMQRRHFEC